MSSKRENQGVDLNQLYNLLIRSKTKKLSLATLEKDVAKRERLRKLLMEKKRLFWLGELESNSWEVRPKVPVRLCHQYKTGGCDGNCQMFHLCKENLLSPELCSRPCKYRLSHNINDPHNKPITDRIFPKGCGNDGGKTKILRSSLPRMCKTFAETGSCATGFCGYLHLCPDYVNERCSGKCKLAKLSGLSKDKTHNITTGHNNVILASFNLNDVSRENRSHLLANILASSNLDSGVSKCMASTIDLTTTTMTRSKQLSSSIAPGASSNRLGFRKSKSATSLLNIHEKTSSRKKSDSQSLSLCYYYINEECRKSSCPRLHICKGYLTGACTMEECVHSHDLIDDHNKSVIHKVKPCVSRTDALELVKKSLPKLCENYVSGQCQWGDECNGVHICKEVLINNTCRIEVCDKSHNLWSPHNKRIAEKFSSKHNNRGSLGQRIDYFKTDIISTFVLSNDTPLDNDSQKFKQLLSQQTESYNKVKEPSEVDVFSYVLNNSTDASMPLMNILDKFQNEFQHKTECVESWIKEHSQSFRMTNADGCKTVHLCLENVMPCYDYWSEAGCSTKPCKMFHICKKFLFGVKHSEVSCIFNHNAVELSQSELAAEHNLKSVSPDHLLMLLRTRFPFVCIEYLKGNCQQDDVCSNIHICGDFIEGKCKKADGVCSQPHESALASRHTMKVMDSFHIAEENYVKCIIVKKEASAIESKISNHKIQGIFNSLKDEAICYRFLNDSCMEGKMCSLEHPDPKTTFLWQYQDGGEWKNYPTNVNNELEVFYCDPKNTSFDFILDSKLAIKPDDVVDFSTNGCEWKGKYCGNHVRVKRLSTKSSVLAAEDDNNEDKEEESIVGFTEWKWYWQTDDKSWKEYDGTVTSEQIETTFLEKTSVDYKFQINNYNYRLDFNEMEQQNLGPKYFTKRKVRRRPVYQDIKEAIKSKDIQKSNQLPSHWPKTMKDGDCIPVKDQNLQQQIEDDFKTSIKKPVEILSLTEVCNLTFHIKYLQTKQSFIKRLGESNVNEKLLYHGTTSDVAPQICVQNFDWRLSGINGTSYGQGSYFARDASYSDSYARADSSGVQYMFIAQVLVGKYTIGNSGMKRPPADEITPGALYDSCVNHPTDPFIYVIFERDQCYPKYLIKYRKKLNHISPFNIQGAIPSVASTTVTNRAGFIPQSLQDVKVGTQVMVKIYGPGVIRWIDSSAYKAIFFRKLIGVELNTAKGNTDGALHGIRYFTCQPNHGVFISLDKISYAW